jgi:opacity protein-like surface antigen
MRSAITVILFALTAVSCVAQEWSEKAHYNAYMKGDWREVVRLGKEAKKAGADYYYIRARNGYANFMLGKYFKAEQEFEKALKFNSTDPFAKRYGYWSSVYAGNAATALVKSSKMSDVERDSIETIRPKWLNSISVVGGYRLSTSSAFNVNLPPDILGNTVTATVNPPGNMPYVSIYLNHQLGNRVSLNHAVNYISTTRPGQITPEEVQTVNIWQVGYLASLSIQVAKKTTVTPSFIMQYWNDSLNKVYDLSATLAVRQQFGNLHATVIGGYFQDTDTNKYMVGGSLTWYPLSNQKLYTITSGGYNLGGDAPNPFVRQTIGGNVFKRAWLKSSFTWNNRVIAFEDVGLDFVNNASDRLVWLWSLSPSYFVTDKLRISLTYSYESRQFFLPNVSNPQNTGESGQFSEQYDIHSFYLGLNYNF